MLVACRLGCTSVGIQTALSPRPKKQTSYVVKINDPGMDFISNLPIEVLEEIFLYLGCDDLIRCSYVSLQWREVINSNKIWSEQCSKARILHKEYLQMPCTVIRNSLNVYKDTDADLDSETNRLTTPCHWRTHYNRYKYLEMNWRNGYYSLIKTRVDVQYYINGLIIGVDHNGLTAYSISDLTRPMCISTKDLSKFVDAVSVKGNLLFYTQDRHLICMKKQDNSFSKHYEITVPTSVKQHCDHRLTTDTRLALKVTDKFLVIQDVTSACSLYFYDFKTGEFLRSVDLHKFTGYPCPHFTCLEAIDDKVFVAYSLRGHHVIIYNYKTDKVDVKVETTLRSSELVVSKNFFCAKLTVNQLEKSCELHVWSVHTGVEVDILCTNRHLPVVLTADDRLIYSEDSRVYVRGLVKSGKDVDFTVEGRLHGMEPVWNNLLLLNLGFSLQLWDLTSGQRRHTFLRENIEDMWVDDRHIIVKLATRRSFGAPGFIIAFW